MIGFEFKEFAIEFGFAEENFKTDLYFFLNQFEKILLVFLL